MNPALGVSRGRIVARLAVEGAVITIFATSVATLLAQWTGGLLRPLLFSTVQWPHSVVDRRVIWLVLLMTALATIFSSIAPLVLATRGDVMSLLKASGLGMGNPASRLRSTFLASQTAMCVALLAAAGLFIQSLHRAITVDLGYDLDRLVLVDAPGFGNESPVAAFAALAKQLASSPGVDVVARTGIGGGGILGILKLQGRDGIPMGQAPRFNFVDGRWAEAMGLRLRTGRSFTDDEIASSAPVAMINRAMAEKFWPGEAAVGQCLGTSWRDCYRVVGVFKDIRYDIAAAAEPYYVLPVPQARVRPELLLRYSRSVTDDGRSRSRGRGYGGGTDSRLSAVHSRRSAGRRTTAAVADCRRPAVDFRGRRTRVRGDGRVWVGVVRCRPSHARNWGAYGTRRDEDSDTE